MTKLSKFLGPEARLLAKRQITDSGCWEWTGGRTSNYGALRVNNRSYLAHRLAWEVWREAIPDGLCVLHKCDNPPCFNPDHLWVGTKAENNQDRDDKGRGVFPTGPRKSRDGFARGERHPNSRITAEIACAIYIDSRSHRKIAAAFGVSRSCVDHIRSGRRWSHATQQPA